MMMMMMFQLKTDAEYIDCFKNRCLCAYINSSSGTNGNITANCKFVKNGKVVATRNIKNNEELYIGYQLSN
jgi:type VI protein secretion system component Hcp